MTDRLLFYGADTIGRANASEPLNPRSIRLRLLRSDEKGPVETVDVTMTVPQAIEAVTQLALAVQSALRRADIAKALSNTDPARVQEAR